MTPDYAITVSGQAITDSVKKRLVSLHITDEAGFTSDTVEITLDDTDGQIALPSTGAKLNVSLGYQETGLVNMGQYVVDELTLEAPPHVLHIKGHAADLKQSLKTPTSKSWRDQKLGDIVTTIANKNGYTASVAQEFAKLSIPHVDQTTESDLHFLTRLADQYGAIAKPAGGHLIFAPQGLAQSVTGKILATQTLTPKDVTHWHVTWNERDNYGAVIAIWHDFDTAETKTEQAGQGNTVAMLKGTYASAESAKTAAQSKHHQLTRQQSSVNITCVGRPELCAETPINLVGFRQGIPVDWVITRAAHTLDRSGYTTTIEAARHLKDSPNEIPPPQTV